MTLTFGEVCDILHTVEELFDDGDLVGLTGAWRDQYMVKHELFHRVREDGDTRSFPSMYTTFISDMVKAFSKKGYFIRLHGWQHGIHFEIFQA